MVAKISHGSSVYGVFEYNQNKVDNGEATVLNSSRFIYDEYYHHSVSNCVKSLEDWLDANRRTEKPMVHISLNPDPKDTIEDDQAIEIAEKYLDQMGYADQPYILYKHEDIARIHYHIVTICVGLDGVKINSDYEKRRSMKACRDIEKEYGLHVPTKQQMKEQSRPMKVDYSRGDIQSQIAGNINTAISNYNIRNITEYKTLLELFNMTVTEVNGYKDGKNIRGLVYSATNEKGEKIGKSLKSSLFPKKYSRKELEKRFEKNKKNQLSNRDRDFMRKVIVQCMYQCKERSRTQFTDLLRKRGMDLILRDTKEGGLFGVTIVDHNTHRILKGSEVDKAFSAKSLKEFFGNLDYIIPFPLENKGLDMENSPTKEKEDYFQKLEDSVFAGLLPSGSEFDPEEEAYKRMLRKKKKIKRNQKIQ